MNVLFYMNSLESNSPSGEHVHTNIECLMVVASNAMVLSISRLCSVDGLTTMQDMEKSRQEAALAKQDLALCQDKVKKLMGQMHLLEKSDAELRGTVDYLKIAGQELPKVQKLLEDANSKASEFKSRASGLHVEVRARAMCDSPGNNAQVNRCF